MSACRSSACSQVIAATTIGLQKLPPFTLFSMIPYLNRHRESL